MADKKKHVQIGKRTLSLSNLDKEMFPGITKAEVIQYYMQVAPTLLIHSKGRALTLKRYPDGIDGESYFQKDTPDWAPDWLERVNLGRDHPKDYIMPTEVASLVWLANMASLEIHQMHARAPDFSKPDYIVYDLDPPETMNFTEVKDVAFLLKDFLENTGYVPFVKTSGGKGLHIFTPIYAEWELDECFEAISDLMKRFVKDHKNTTLQLKKDQRKGRLLIDIYRNRRSQTVVAPYSLRATENAPVSMPVSWKELEKVRSAKDYVLGDILPLLESDGDAWEGMEAAATPLHTHPGNKKKQGLTNHPHRKNPGQLKEYMAKRDFERTPEPQSLFEGGNNTGFVVHRHNASHLHYDLRLEHEGVLQSWAVPKGMPPEPGIKRLAVQTEDHPMEYITFQGDIPRAEYGGGRMWIYANGKYQITKQKKDGFYFSLTSPQLTGEYRMHRMNPKEWILERVDTPQFRWLEKDVDPMLAIQVDKFPGKGNWVYELKWDGIRGIIKIADKQVRIYSRNHQDLTDKFPELQEMSFRGENAVFDGEIVCFDDQGKPDFHQVISRMHGKNSKRKEKRAWCYLFDVLYLDGRSVMHEPLWKRKLWLEESLKDKTGAYRISQQEEDGKALFRATGELGLEGIMIKDPDSTYLPGRRSESWLKLKVRRTHDVYLIGYTEGEGDRASTFGALHMAEQVDGHWVYRGKVGTGFDEKEMKRLAAELPEKTTGPPENMKEGPPFNRSDNWIEPLLMAEVQYASMTKRGLLREPVYVRQILDI